MVKLNLGCGFKKRDGFVNIDSSGHCSPDLVLDLNEIPWPFDGDSVDEVVMESVIEHLPADPKKFFAVLQELYRVCADNAKVYVECPYPTHRWQLVDLTHTKAIHPESLELLNAQTCHKLASAGSTKSPLALMYDIDFELLEYSLSIDKGAKDSISRILGKFDDSLLRDYVSLFNNVGSVQRFTLRCRKKCI